jgi:asparagine synthase (glutamine-hydrolysing)
MCGIVGAYRLSDPLPDDGARNAALSRLRRRGPDHTGAWFDQGVWLGHQRLSVLELSTAGHQPMLSSDGRFAVVYNGELYNHAELRARLRPMGGWRGGSDTETLVEAYRAWGPACLQELNGMFALAIWDRHDRRLFLARDRLGVKPLYYRPTGRNLTFGSRPSAVRALDRAGTSPDLQALRLYLELGYIPAPLTFYRDVRKLPPAHYLLADERGVRLKRYWDFRPIRPSEPNSRTEADLAEELDAMVRMAVRRRLLSDVPLGAFLSGGVDSALVVAAMKAEGGAAPKAFTISFREREYDEGPAAAKIAAHIGVDHTHETLSVSELVNLLPMFIEEFDEPLADSSAFPTMAVARLARRHVTVALTGDGGDEIFGGYPYYRWAEQLAPMTRWSRRLRKPLQGLIGIVPGHRAKLMAGALGTDNAVRLHNYMRGISKDFAPLLDRSALDGTSGAASWFEQFAASFAMDLSTAETGMRLDIGLMLPDMYLQKVDVATMAYSLEGRCPFLDYQLVEWAMRLPVGYKLRGTTTKSLLKRVLCRYLPAHLVYQPKRGFGVPVAAWLRGPLRSWAAALLNERRLFEYVPLDRGRLRELYRLHVTGARDAHPLLWGSLMLLGYVARHELGAELPETSVPRAA